MYGASSIVAVEGDRSGSAGTRWRFVPIVGWIRSYQRRWLRGDLIAGFAVAALIVPKNLGYAGIAGIPLQNGLYAAAAGAILYPIFGTSRQISTGPSSGLAAVAASAVAVAGITGTDDVASFVALMTLASGALFLVLAVLRMGWIAQFLSRAVVTGFLFGAAIDVVIGELPKLTGTEATRLELAARARVVGPDPRRHPTGDGGGRRRCAGGRVRTEVRSRPPSRAPSSWWSAVCWRRGCSISPLAGSPWSATCHEAFRRSRSPTPKRSATMPGRSPSPPSRSS